MTHSSLGETQPNSAGHGKELAEFLQGNNGKYSTMRADGVTAPSKAFPVELWDVLW